MTPGSGVYRMLPEPTTRQTPGIIIRDDATERPDLSPRLGMTAPSSGDCIGIFIIVNGRSSW
jgi:hypothetical protein